MVDHTYIHSKGEGVPRVTLDYCGAAPKRREQKGCRCVGVFFEGWKGVTSVDPRVLSRLEREVLIFVF